MVPTGNLVMMIVNVLLGIAVPLFLCWWAVKKHKANIATILIGAAVFVVTHEREAAGYADRVLRMHDASLGEM